MCDCFIFLRRDSPVPAPWACTSSSRDAKVASLPNKKTDSFLYGVFSNANDWAHDSGSSQLLNVNMRPNGELEESVVLLSWVTIQQQSKLTRRFTLSDSVKVGHLSSDLHQCFVLSSSWTNSKSQHPCWHLFLNFFFYFPISLTLSLSLIALLFCSSPSLFFSSLSVLMCCKVYIRAVSPHLPPGK